MRPLHGMADLLEEQRAERGRTKNNTCNTLTYKGREQEVGCRKQPL